MSSLKFSFDETSLREMGLSEQQIQVLMNLENLQEKKSKAETQKKEEKKYYDLNSTKPHKRDGKYHQIPTE
jgi:Tfp pilus assembly protein PilN